MSKGRTVQIVTFDLENGETIRLRRVSPTIALLLRMGHPQPDPPIDAATGDPNPAHPSYQKAMDAYKELLGNLTMYAMVDYGTDFEMDEQQSADAAQLRSVLNRYGAAIPDAVSDKALFICHSLCGGENEIGRLIDAIQKQNPTEREVQQTAESFRSDVEGQINLEMPNTQGAIQYPVRSANRHATGDD